MNNIENLEKVFATWEKTTEQLWDITRQAMGTLNWNQDQLGKYFQKSLEQGQQTCQEANRIMDEFASQFKNNQLYFQKVMEESVVGAVKNFELPRVEYFDDLFQKLTSYQNPNA